MINIKKEDIEKSNSWPFVEAKKIIKERIPVSIDFIILLRQRVKHNLSLLYIKYH